jgi:hypothetical protein
MNTTSTPPPGNIAERAYQLWEAAGRPTGRDEDFWCEAERELCVGTSAPPAAPAAPAPAAVASQSRRKKRGPAAA